ncbi:MAG TPA: membrane protein insertion efficiency factor YidD [Ilumatobacteraceae bacterium]|nr:membrane protein insertion efficiency factor YidD [Ilumatobacteraceae bacterium]
MTWMQRRALASIEVYQRAFAGRPSPCRFYPTCSVYAHQAYAAHGTVRGSWLTVRRLVRCRPWGPSGFDPVPEAVTYGNGAGCIHPTSTAQEDH